MTYARMAAAAPVEGDSDPALADSLEAARIIGWTSLRALRLERRLTTVDLARQAGIPHDDIVALESGAPFTMIQLYALAAVLNVPASTLSS